MEDGHTTVAMFVDYGCLKVWGTFPPQYEGSVTTIAPLGVRARDQNPAEARHSSYIGLDRFVKLWTYCPSPGFGHFKGL